MDKLVLGDRVDSSSAMDLPLDLALALLRDSDGKIDLGLPVSGSLDDPEFSYGALIWKVIVNVVTKVVTAPFRALGSLLGVNADKMESVAFDAGRAELLPPEREKLSKLPEALAKRPALVLTVAGGYDPTIDGDAIKELRLRRAVAQQSGRQLGPNEEPGPISTAQAATREALDKLYTQRFGADALASLQQQHAQANPDAQPASAAGRVLSKFSSMLKKKPPPLSEEETARLRGVDLQVLLMQRLLEAEVVDEAVLRALANERAEAIRRELSARGLAPARLKLVEPQAQRGEGVTVNASLGLEPATNGAAAAPAPAASGPAAGRRAG
jgi:hypothetical protein